MDWATLAATGSTTRPPLAAPAAYFCISARSTSIPSAWVTAATVFSCGAARNKWWRCCVFLMETSFENCLLRFAEPRGPDASPSGGPQRSQAHCGHSRASDSPKQCSVHRSKLPSSALSLPFCEIRPRCAFPRAGAFGHSDWAASTPIRGRRSLAESRYSL